MAYAFPAGGGNFTLISSTSAASTSSVVITSGLLSTYKYMKIVCTGLKVVQGGGTFLRLRCSTDGGSTYDSGNNYSYTSFYHGSDSANDWNRGNAQSSMLLAIPIPESGTSTDNGGFDIDIFNVASASQYKLFSGQLTMLHSSTIYVTEFSGSYNSATAVNALQFSLNDSGNLVTGIFNLYGVT